MKSGQPFFNNDKLLSRVLIGCITGWLWKELIVGNADDDGELGEDDLSLAMLL